MRNVTKLLCVVLALVVALSAASCSLTKQSSYKDDEIDLPVGVYIYYLYQAYNEAQNYAQQSDKYNSTTGKYDGKKSFLKMEITDSDKNTAVAEDWIIDKATEDLKNAIAIKYEFAQVGATMDELGPNNTQYDLYKALYPDYYESLLGEDAEQKYSGKLSETAKEFETYGIGFESWLFVTMLPIMKEATFHAEYAEDGPNAVTKDDVTKYFTENYSSFVTLSANLYTSETEEGSDTPTDVAMSDKDIKKYEDAFKSYAKEVSDGKAMDDVVAEYNEEFGAEATSVPNVQKIDKDTDDELNKAVLSLKEGEATSVIIGKEGETNRTIYLIYKAPIKDKVSEYIDDETQYDNLVHEMNEDAFEDLLKDLIEEKNFKPSSACSGYKPSMFEKKKK